MVDYLVSDKGLSREDAFMLCSIAMDLHITQVVDGTKGVHAMLPKFVINIPSQDLKRQIYYCGFHSGGDVDKFKETGLTPQPARHANVPIIRECVAHMECKVEKAVNTGDKRLFIAIVIDAYADEDVSQGRRTIKYSSGDFPKKVYGIRFTDLNNENARQDTPAGVDKQRL